MELKTIGNLIRKNYKPILSVLLLFCVIGGLFYMAHDVDAYVSVKGYFRKDGTYVRPHVRSNPNALKYDNYSWKPGQGLYNKSYSAPTKDYSSDWYKPSYITDSEYHIGKNLYESGNYLPSYGNSSSNLSGKYYYWVQKPNGNLVRIKSKKSDGSYTERNAKFYANKKGYTFVIGQYNFYPEKPVISKSGYKKFDGVREKVVCGLNEERYGTSCYCIDGFKKNSSSICEKVICSPNAHLGGWNKNICYCNEGYKKNYSTGQCEKVICGANTHLGGWNKDTCYCNKGYKKNYSTGICKKVVCGLNAHLGSLNKDTCYCDKGYKKNYSTGKCEKVACGPNAHIGGWNKNICYCDKGYKKNYLTNSCDVVIVPSNAHLNYRGNDWVCDKGFVKDYFFNTCKIIK